MPAIVHGSPGAIITPRSAFSQPFTSAGAQQTSRSARTVQAHNEFDAQLAQWMQWLESNAQQTVGHSQRAALAAEGAAEQHKYHLARHEAGAVIQLGHRLNAVQGKAQAEANFLSENFANCEQSELRLAQFSTDQRMKLEFEANALFSKRMSVISDENLAERKAIVAHIEGMADDRHMTYRAKVLSEIAAATDASKEAQNLACDLAMKLANAQDELHDLRIVHSECQSQSTVVRELRQEVMEMRNCIAHLEENASIQAQSDAKTAAALRIELQALSTSRNEELAECCIVRQFRAEAMSECTAHIKYMSSRFQEKLRSAK